MSDDTGRFDEDEAMRDDTADDVELDIEAPEADAAEQHADVVQRRDAPVIRGTDEVNPADAAEQSRVVELDEDDYR